MAIFHATSIEIAEGQQYDMDFETRTDVTEAEYIEMIRLKTSVLLACALKIGAILGGATKEDAEHLYRLGESIGLAFQLRDDYLDVFVEDMKYSDTPIRKSIAEDLADIYQAVKDFVCQFQSGLNETMHDALATVREQFASYWGQTLVNTMRALHEVKFSKSDDEEEEVLDD
jgi:geranylgeranyl pyrophosphate synthase